MTPPPENSELWIGFGLFIASELLALSKAKDNSVLQLVLHLARELFPYELQRREPASRANRPRPRQRRDANGQFTSSRKSNATRD
jgi:hypothetical protein